VPSSRRLAGSFASSYMFTPSGPARGAALDCRRGPRPDSGRLGPRGSGRLSPVGGELSFETVAYCASPFTPISAEAKHSRGSVLVAGCDGSRRFRCRTGSEPGETAN
jgi:hypothetical protein